LPDYLRAAEIPRKRRPGRRGGRQGQRRHARFAETRVHRPPFTDRRLPTAWRGARLGL